MVSFEDCNDYFVVVFMSPEIVCFNASITKDRIEETVKGNVITFNEQSHT